MRANAKLSTLVRQTHASKREAMTQTDIIKCKLALMTGAHVLGIRDCRNMRHTKPCSGETLPIEHRTDSH